MVASINDHTLQTRRTLPYPPAAIYAAFADAACLARWWGPAGFTNTFELFEFWAGGRWTFVMHGPDGTHYPNECTFAELEAGAKVVVRHVSHPHFTLSISLLPAGEGTEVHWVQAFDDPAVAAAVRHIAEPGNEQNLDRLFAVLRGAS